MSEDRKAWFREHLRSRVKSAGQDLSSLDDIRRSAWMTKVYVEDVLAGAYRGEVAPRCGRDADAAA